MMPHNFHPPICPVAYFLPIVMKFIGFPSLYSFTSPFPVNTDSRAADRWMIIPSMTVTCFGSRLPTSPIPQIFCVPVTRIVLSRMTLPVESRRVDGTNDVLSFTPKRGRYKSAERVVPFESLIVV